MEPEKQTPEQKAAARAEVLRTCKAESEQATELIKRHDEWLKEAEALFPAPWCFGDKRRQKKEKSFSALYNRVYYGRLRYRHNVERFADEDRKAAEAVTQAVYDAGRKEIDDRAAAEYKRLKTAAVVWLQAKGKVLGIHFDVDNALEFADTIAGEEWLANVKPGLYSFDGEDNCEGCGGWNGVDHRCACGNRRVYWERSDSHTFENPAFNAVAY